MSSEHNFIDFSLGRLVEGHAQGSFGIGALLAIAVMVFVLALLRSNRRAPGVNRRSLPIIEGGAPSMSRRPSIFP